MGANSKQFINVITSIRMMVQCCPENTDAVRVALGRYPSKLARKVAAEVGISRRSMQRILKGDLNLYP
jgi:hypothetical protein